MKFPKSTNAALLGGLALLLWLAPASSVMVHAARPNILLIVSEDNGPELGCYGNMDVRTPHLDRLAGEGVRFENAFVPQAGCSQSRAAFLTGLYPHQNGQIGLATWKFAMRSSQVPNVVRRLKAAGYRTGIIGKLHINPATAFPFDLHEIPSSNFGRKRLGDYARFASEFFTADDKPFFLSVNLPDAHRPFTPRVKGIPEKPLTRDEVTTLPYMGLDSPELREDTANYYNCMERLDWQVGQVLEQLDQSGKADQTLVIYFGDHGADLLRGKRTCYEGGLRVPLIIRWPGQTKSETVRSELVSTLDLAPTLLAAAGAEVIPDLPGRSLQPLLGGAPAPWRKLLFSEFHLHSPHNFYPQRAVRDGRFKLIQSLYPGETNPGYEFTFKKFYSGLSQRIAAADERIRNAYARMEKPPEYELYDLTVDPYEFDNLADRPEYAAKLETLKAALSDWRHRTADPLLDRTNLEQLRADVQACFRDGKPEKTHVNWTFQKRFWYPIEND